MYTGVEQQEAYSPSALVCRRLGMDCKPAIKAILTEPNATTGVSSDTASVKAILCSPPWTCVGKVIRLWQLARSEDTSYVSPHHVSPYLLQHDTTMSSHSSHSTEVQSGTAGAS
jgi:hypothetical protein